MIQLSTPAPKPKPASSSKELTSLIEEIARSPHAASVRLLAILRVVDPYTRTVEATCKEYHLPLGDATAAVKLAQSVGRAPDDDDLAPLPYYVKLLAAKFGETVLESLNIQETQRQLLFALRNVGRGDVDVLKQKLRELVDRAPDPTRARVSRLLR